jgi:hypothetical protein
LDVGATGEEPGCAPVNVRVALCRKDGRMIRVLVELWPGGDATRPEVLGEVAIANVTPYDDPASYVVAVVGADGDLRDVHTVSGHKRADGWQALVSAALSPGTVDPSEETADFAVAAAELLRHGRPDRGINRDG